MSTITKERVAGIASGEKCYTHDDVLELARIALASLEAEPVGYFGRFDADDEDLIDQCSPSINGAFPLYAAPPAPVSVPDAMEMDDDFDSAFEHGKAVGWNAYRAAMLQSFGNSEQLNSPVIPDDVRRMDWLVSKTVDVREPMVYGSHSLFWSQTITDEEDDYHATKLREQIDAAMEAEQAAAPQQEVK
ncbi:hypothetical protein [Enterobacter asburiae]|uniref:hypothetical protein n=1 Tax=Enterobacter asburiae TaxID=61645 RepID=UPI001E2CE987|nr:hypothetical protein [Enterobacter asburiae]MCE1325736.1 hypothetical protein [Enterobacter asburiae]